MVVQRVMTQRMFMVEREIVGDGSSEKFAVVSDKPDTADDSSARLETFTLSISATHQLATVPTLHEATTPANTLYSCCASTLA